MKFKIHRGTKEIGGSCVEVWTESTRILVDFGMPIVDENGNEFNFNQYKNDNINELIQKNILPDIKGLYDNNSLIDGVVISHAHLDHYGLINYISKDIQFYLGEATYKIIELSNIFTSQNIKLEKVKYFEKNLKFQIGDISITPFGADHSAFDSYSFLIEADGKSIFYSGDFRSHGRKANAFNRFTNNAPKNVNYLLLEGTTINQVDKVFKSEYKLQDEFLQLFKQQNKINLVYTSGQNIDRLVTIFKASLEAKKTLVIDVYIAKILKELSKFAKLPYNSEDYKNIKVIFTYYTGKKLDRDGNKSILYEFKKFKITKEEVSEQFKDIVMIVRPSMKKELELIKGIDNGNFIYSMWSGYLRKKSTSEFVEFIKNKGFTFHNIHTSGHADTKTLIKMVEAIQPKCIVPIHTFERNKYQDIFKYPIKELNDKEIQEV